MDPILLISVDECLCRVRGQMDVRCFSTLTPLSSLQSWSCVAWLSLQVFVWHTRCFRLWLALWPAPLPQVVFSPVIGWAGEVSLRMARSFVSQMTGRVTWGWSSFVAQRLGFVVQEKGQPWAFLQWAKECRFNSKHWNVCLHVSCAAVCSMEWNWCWCARTGCGHSWIYSSLQVRCGKWLWTSSKQFTSTLEWKCVKGRIDLRWTIWTAELTFLWLFVLLFLEKFRSLWQNSFLCRFFRCISEARKRPWWHDGLHDTWHVLYCYNVSLDWFLQLPFLLGQFVHSSRNMKTFRIIRLTRLLKTIQFVKIFRFVMALRMLVTSIISTLKVPLHRSGCHAMSCTVDKV